MTARTVLPQRRFNETFDLRHKTETGDVAYAVTIGFAESAGPFLTPVEVFINGPKAGSGVEAVARDAAVLLSIALQYGVPLAVVQGAITRDAAGAPSSAIGAVVDLLMKRDPETEQEPKPSWRDALKERIRRAVIEAEGHP
jgi:hypothetical protein